MNFAREFDLEQYRALRSEVLRAMEDGTQTMSFGVATYGIIMGAGVQIYSTFSGFMLFALPLPLLACLVLSMWFAAHERVARASHFLSGIEARLSEGLTVPSWEAWLRPTSPQGKSRHFWGTEHSGIAIFIFLILFPLLLSLSAGGSEVSLPSKAITVGSTFFLAGAFLISLRGRYLRWRNWLSSRFEPQADLGATPQ